MLAAWAIQARSDTVLEPSFGGCGFLASSRDCLQRLGSKTPQSTLYGCDVDSNAFDHLRKTFQEPFVASHFHHGDFLAHTPDQSWPEGFDVVLGNPPYLPFQKVNMDAREIARKRLKNYDLNVPARSSLWAYFVGLGMTYLRDGGRMAWVLPGSFLRADYAASSRKMITNAFSRTQAFYLKERIFLSEGTDEETVVLLCEGYNYPGQKRGNDIGLDVCDNIPQLQRQIDRWSNGVSQLTHYCCDAIVHRLTNAERAAYIGLSKSDPAKPLGNYLSLKVGIVTGDNTFFLFDKKKCAQTGIDRRSLKPILTKFSHTSGLTLAADQVSINFEEGKRTHFLSVPEPTKRRKAIQEFLSSYPDKKRKETSTFKKRSIWSHSDDNNPSGAFFPVMHHDGPRLVLNEAGICSTNTVHRAYFKSEVTPFWEKIIAISLLSTFSQISAEIVGRSYGSGVLKHEPREGEKILILVPESLPTEEEIESIFDEVSKLLKAGLVDEARFRADRFLLYPLFGSGFADLQSLLEAGLQRLRKLRHR